MASNCKEPDEVGKYRKYKGGDISKSSAKANHKHQYVPCLLRDDKYFNSCHYSEYCTICGKIHDKATRYLEIGPNNVMLTPNEIMDKYRGLPIFVIDIFKDKHVNVDGYKG
jgi:hypothetical protein